MNKSRIFLGSSDKQTDCSSRSRAAEEVADVEPWTTTFNPGAMSASTGSPMLSQEVYFSR